MKKVGIATIFDTGNYGATLQAFALKEAINDNELAQAEIINYCCDAVKGKIDINYLKKAGAVKTAVALVDRLIYAPRMKKMRKFISSLVSTDRLTRDMLPSINNDYDIFLSGSDQIWNTDIQQGDFYYLLDFVNDSSKKRSFASSFGRTDLPDEYKETYKALLSEYQRLSVREKVGADIVEELLGVRPSVVLDPTLLLSPSKWESLLPRSREKKPYIFVYRLTYSTLLTGVSKALSKKLDRKVVCAPFLIGFAPFSAGRLSLDSLEWMEYIRGSEYVVTDSFHGVVFSIIFSRQFYYILSSPSAKQRISRLETLLDHLGIYNRIVTSLDECDFDSKIDYEVVHNKLNKLREESMNVLREVLE